MCVPGCHGEPWPQEGKVWILGVLGRQEDRNEDHEHPTVWGTVKRGQLRAKTAAGRDPTAGWAQKQG